MENSKTIVVTGFGPFGDHKINASWEAVKLLPDNFEKYEIVKKEVPVIYTHVESTVPLLWKNYNPQLVIHVGVSGFTDKIQIETCANKQGYSRADCIGLGHSTGNVCPEGDDCIHTEINTQEICDNVNKNGSFNVGTSCNAGRYLCEFIYYLSMSINNKRALFIHVPPLDKPYSAETLRDAIMEIIRCTLKQLEE